MSASSGAEENGVDFAHNEDYADRIYMKKILYDQHQIQLIALTTSRWS